MTKKDVIPECFYQESKQQEESLYGSKKKKQKRGCLIKDFRHDGGGGFPAKFRE